jgi:hypothetical protein
VNTSTRCAGLVLASLAVIILNLAAQTSPKLSDHDLIRKVTPAHRLRSKQASTGSWVLS